jgi:hypothetical protein
MTIDSVFLSSAQDSCPRCHGLGFEAVGTVKLYNLAIRQASLIQFDLDADPTYVSELHVRGRGARAPTVCTHCAGSCINVRFEDVIGWLQLLRDPAMAQALMQEAPETAGFNFDNAYVNACDFVDSAGEDSCAMVRPESVIFVYQAYSRVRYAVERALLSHGAPAEVED